MQPFIKAVPILTDEVVASNEHLEQFLIADAGATLLLVGEEFVEAIDGIRADLPAVERFIAFGATGANGWNNYRGWVVDYPTAAPERALDPDGDVYQM